MALKRRMPQCWRRSKSSPAAAVGCGCVVTIRRCQSRWFGAIAAGTAAVLLMGGPGLVANGFAQAPPAGFGRSGLITTALSGQDAEAQRMVVDAAGRITVAGSGWSYARRRQTFVMVRYLADGSRDPSFGSGGIVSMVRRDRGANDYSENVSMVAQPDGKLVVAGLVSVRESSDRVDAIQVRRYLPGGALDRSFGSEGSRTVPFLGGESVCGAQPQAVALGPAGTIVVSGSEGCGGEGDEEKDLVIARLLADGRIDDSFGQGGITSPAAPMSGEGLAVQPDSSIVVAGSDNGTQVFATGHLTVIHLFANGSSDPSFGPREFSFAGFELSDAAELAVDGTGEIVVAGNGFNKNQTRSAMGIARLPSDGRAEPATVKFTPRRHWQVSAAGIALAPDGSIVVAGTEQRRSRHRALLARVTPDGRSSQRIVRFGSTWDQATDVAVLPDGSAVVAGWTRRGHGRSRIALARLKPS